MQLDATASCFDDLPVRVQVNISFLYKKLQWQPVATKQYAQQLLIEVYNKFYATVSR